MAHREREMHMHPFMHVSAIIIYIHQTTIYNALPMTVFYGAEAWRRCDMICNFFLFNLFGILRNTVYVYVYVVCSIYDIYVNMYFLTIVSRDYVKIIAWSKPLVCLIWKHISAAFDS